MGDKDEGTAQGTQESIVDTARARATRATADAALDAAGSAASKVAHSMLDGLETLLFGRVGGAEEAATEKESDPLARMRQLYTAPPAPAPAPAREDPVARARADLDALKAARKSPAAVKKTL